MTEIIKAEFPKTALNRKASDVYEAATRGPVSLSEHGTSRFVLMSRRIFDEHFARADTRRAVHIDDMSDAEADALVSALEARVLARHST
jgi:hypothetical protein